MEEDKSKNLHTGHRERVREKYLEDKDMNSFNDIQALEVILFSAIPRKDTNPIAHELLDKFGSLHSVFSALPYGLMQISDMTENAAYMLSSILPLARKAEISRAKNNKIFVTNPTEAVNLLIPFFRGKYQEAIYIMMLDLNDRLIQTVRITDGNTDSSFIDIPKIVTACIRNQVSKMILAHNHPGGSLDPSEEDKKATVSLAATLRGINVTLIDHIIVTEESYHSMNSSGEMERCFLASDYAHGTNMCQESRLRKKKISNPDTYIFEEAMRKSTNRRKT